ncbi:MAG: tetratricopeptide repeat protein [Bacteroidales bacterium]|nr:tetratricopeptide repeat protein [Bacteroidales bacterium]
MRKNLLLRLFIMLVLTMMGSCLHKKSIFTEKNTPHHFKELSHAVDLMTEHCDKALEYLDSLNNADAIRDWNVIEQQEFQVRLAEALYKNGKLGPQRLDMNSTVEFFDSLSLCHPKDRELCFLQANAHYYLGAERRYRQEDVLATSDFVTALKIMREEFDGSDRSPQTRFIGLTYFRLGEILNSYNVQSTAITMFDSARCCFERVYDTLGIAACIRNIGEVYQANKDYEKALSKFKEANKLWNFGDALYDHVIGGVFFNHHQWDSASYYLERSFFNSGPYARIDASAKLAEIYRSRGDKEKEDYYTLFYVQNSLKEANRSSDKMEIEFLCDATKTDVTSGTEQPKSDRRVLIMVLSIFVVVAFLTFIIVHNRHRISHIEQHLSTMEQIHREETEGKDQQIQAISQQLDDTKQALERQRHHSTPFDFDQAMESFLRAPITLKIHKAVDGKDIMTKSVSLYPHLKLSEVEFIEVVRTANKCFPDFSSMLLRDYRSLSTADVRHCCLALMGLNDAEIAVMEGITYSGANRRTNRILSVMDARSGLAECVIVYLKKLF